MATTCNMGALTRWMGTAGRRAPHGSDRREGQRARNVQDRPIRPRLNRDPSGGHYLPLNGRS